jgi:hypothetical protein
VKLPCEGINSIRIDNKISIPKKKLKLILPEKVFDKPLREEIHWKEE